MGFSSGSSGGGGAATDTIYDAKGDVVGGTGANTSARLAVGSNGKVLTANSGETTGLEWTTPSAATTIANDTIWAAKGDVVGATGNDAASVLTVGADDTILMADAAAATGLKWVASASPSAISTAAATGTSDTFTRGDHVHAHEAAHVAHDTLFDAAGDLVVGTGADTSGRLAIGAAGTILRTVSGTPAWVSEFLGHAKWGSD